MAHAILQQYIKLTGFLGAVLGPDYEVALHDISEPESSIIAIANGHISGRTIGAPLTDMARHTIADKSYEENDSRINYTGVATENGRMLRSSTYFIKDETGRLLGLLCINFDDSRYRELSDRLLKLRHPDVFVDANFVFNKEKARPEGVPGAGAESFHESVTSVTEEVIAQVIGQGAIPLDRLTFDEKMEIVTLLNEKGVFLIKNAVRQVAEHLRCSQASVYRYIGKLGKARDTDAKGE